MDQIFNDPIISNFLLSIKQSDKKITLKELILLGISTISSKVHSGCCCSNIGTINKIRSPGQCGSFGQCACKCTFVPNISRVYQTGAQWNQSMISQIQRMKNRINQLQSYINNSGQNRQIPQFVHEGENARQYLGTTQTQTHPQGQEKKQLNVQAQIDPQGIKKQFRHHLDDSQVRKALINPYAKISPKKQKRKQRKQQIDKNHLMQKQRDEQQLRKIRTKNQMGSLGGGGIGGMHANINEQYDQESEQYQKQKINSKQKSKSKQKQKEDRNPQNINNNNYKFKNIDDKSQGKNSRNGLNQILAEQNIHTINTISSKKGYSQNKSHQVSHKSSTIVNNATSKIKTLIERDKNRSKNNKNFKNNAFAKKQGTKNSRQEKYCQFEYSDQQQYSEQQQSYNNNQKQNDPLCPIHNTTGKQSSSFSQHSVSGFTNQKQEKKNHHKTQNTKQFKNTYKQTRKKIKQSIKKNQSEQEQQDQYNQNNQIEQQSKISKQDDHQSDTVSQSSSFSRFSLSSRRDRERQTGKISGLRKI